MIKLNCHKREITIEKLSKLNNKPCDPYIQICLGNQCRNITEDDFYLHMYKAYEEWFGDSSLELLKTTKKSDK